jgi:hypothetical protein
MDPEVAESFCYNQFHLWSISQLVQPILPFVSFVNDFISPLLMRNSLSVLVVLSLILLIPFVFAQTVPLNCKCNKAQNLLLFFDHSL